MGIKLGKWRSRTNLSFVDPSLHHPLIFEISFTKLNKNNLKFNCACKRLNFFFTKKICQLWDLNPRQITLIRTHNTKRITLESDALDRSAKLT